MGQNVIELNGKRYDAISGAFLGKSHVIPKHITEQYVRGKVIDGFVRPSHPTASKPVSQKKEVIKPTAAPAPIPKPAAAPVHAPASHLKPHTPERSRTLMKRAVRKPEFSLKPTIKTQAPAEMMAKVDSSLMRKRSVYRIDPVRRERANLTNQHQAIQHFNLSHRPPASHTVAQVPVLSVRPAPLAATARNAQPTPRKQPDIFEAAIAHASSHEQPMHKPRKQRSRRRLTNSLAVVGAFLVLGGFIGYLNLPQLELRVASIQAGFGASIPAYTPTGYALEGGVKRTGGTVSLSFRSGDSRYTITQQSSNWNSQTLLDNTLALSGGHQAIQKNGQTIYMYGNGSNAAWVNAGVRYDITGNAQLSKDDITAIATSL